ncbi:MAG TPA: acyl carrier protein [Alphaproteobacteria bacterium]|nr:acyl carrier protein [Alphaproteobacteria bacterium]
MNKNSTTFDVLEEEIKKLAPGRAVSPATSVTRDLGLDSLAVMNFIMVLEDRFDISIPMDMIAEIETLKELEKVIETLKVEQDGA